jgi:serine/threonine protein kinase/tetratricopeptide (TPR) repeat protein
MLPGDVNRHEGAAGWEGAAGEAPARLSAGEVLSERFVVERFAGRGGMGAVYRALDRLSGEPVALKMLARLGQHERRFAQEARVLAELRHPAIVRYVAHGETAQRQPYLAMQWLEGEDLSQRLARSRLTVGESLDMARRVAEGLAAAHGRRVVHRDVKPSNVLLVDGHPARATLLDFGIARTELSGVALTAGPMTRTGVVLGTVGYMSPEQATGDKRLDARTDVFALGCMLFECLTGDPVFSGEHVVAVLAKVLRAEAPRLRSLRPELPEALDDLVARMLSKDPASRARDGAALLEELVALGTVTGEAPTMSSRPSPGLSSGERRMVSVMLARLEGSSHAVASATNTHERLLSELSFVRDRASRHGGEAVRLTDGTLLVTFSGGGATAMERAGRAARCAHELRSMHPAAAVALATGFAQTAERLPVGDVIDRAAALLSGQAESRTTVDAVTASLVEARFEVRDESGVRILGAPRPDDEEARTLLGKPTPCVGRDRELAMLLSLLDECIEEKSPRAVLVTAPPGVGKSRFRQEFLGRVRETKAARVVVARADSMSAGSAFVLARQIVQRTAGLAPSDPWDVQQTTLRTRLLGRIDAKEAGLLAEFLCELLGVPVQTEPSPILRAARGDPRLLADWLRSSFEDWLKVEAREPLLVVLEDLHWGDAPTVTYLSRVLKEGHLPLMVLALARPDVHEAFPKLWSGALHEVPLGGLGKKAAEQLVRAVLTEPDAATVARVVERADGNAFYLEELIRAVAEGRGDVLPETVVAMAHARLEHLEPRVRRVLRAASVLGEVFWVSGLTAIVGSEQDTASSLVALEEQEVIARSRGDRFPAEHEYVFRHALVRDAAYATLTEGDKSAGHRLAAEWLARAGESDPLVMADHLEKGGEPARAVPWIIRAAAAASDGGGITAAMRLAERGIGHAKGEDLGVLKAIQGVCAGANNELEKAFPVLREAMTLLPKGGRYWFVSASNLAFYGALAGDPSATLELARAIVDLPPIATTGGLYAWSAARVVMALMYAGQSDWAQSFLDRLEAAAALQTSHGPSFVGWLAIARMYPGYFGKREDLAAVVRNIRIAVVTFEETRDSAALASARFWQGLALVCLGRYSEVAEVARRGMASAEQSGNTFMGRALEAMRCCWLPHSGRATEAVALLTPLANDPQLTVAQYCAINLAHALVLTGDAEGAERVARDTVEKSRGMVPLEASAYAALARILLVRGRAQESLAAADRALAFPVLQAGFCDDLRLARAEALHALGRTQDARGALREERDRVLRTAATLEEDDRTSYLLNVDANVRTLALAKEWLTDG